LARDATFGRRARRWAARLFVLGALIGAVAAFIPAVQWMLFGDLPGSLFVGATVIASLGAILGMLTGASKTPSSLQASPDASLSES
jgi:hypothetical protein